MKHVCIFLHPLVGADILFQQVLEPKSEIVFSKLKNELLFSNRTVSEMADDFNFSDPSHLMRFFKQQTGKTFTQYMTDYNKGIYE